MYYFLDELDQQSRCLRDERKQEATRKKFRWWSQHDVEMLDMSEARIIADVVSNILDVTWMICDTKKEARK